MVALVAGAAISWAWAATDPRLDARLDAATRDKVSAIVDSAQREGLETEPLIDRALEASSKRAPGPRIVSSVRLFLRDMRRAREALGGAGSPDEVTAGARALQAGVDVKHLERLRAARSGQRFASALNAVIALTTGGVPADTAAKVFVNLVLASASETQISSLLADIERDIAGGTPAGLAATARGAGLERVIAAQTDGGAPGATLPSARGTTRAADPSATGAVGGTATGNTAPGSPNGPAAPRGKAVKRP
jgi:hypothetical protein